MDVDDIFKKLSAGAIFTKRPPKSSKLSSPDLSRNSGEEKVQSIEEEDHSTAIVIKGESNKNNKKTELIEIERVSFLCH